MKRWGLAGLVVLVGACLLSSLAFSNTAHQTRDVLGEVNLGKSIDLAREMNQTQQIGLGLIDRLVWVNALYGVVLAVIVMAAAFAFYKGARAVTSRHAQQGGGIQYPQMESQPRFVALGQRGDDYLLLLPAPEQDLVYRDLVAKVALLQQVRGRQSVNLLDHNTGKETRWR